MLADANAPQLMDKPDVVPRQCRDFPSRDRNASSPGRAGGHLGVSKRRGGEVTDQLLKRTHERSGPGMTNRGENPGSDQAPRAISRMRRVTGSQQGRELNHWCVTGHGKKIKLGPPWTAHHHKLQRGRRATPNSGTCPCQKSRGAPAEHLDAGVFPDASKRGNWST